MEWTSSEFTAEASNIASCLDHWTFENGCLVQDPIVRASYSNRNCYRESMMVRANDDKDGGLYIESVFEDTEVVAKDSEDFAAAATHTEWRISIVYHDTWQVPVLYFTVERPGSGEPLPRCEIVTLLRCGDRDDASSFDPEFLTAEEHPVTGNPSFVLHPCRTADRVTLLDTETKLLSWLTMILPTLGFSVSPKTYSYIQKNMQSIS